MYKIVNIFNWQVIIWFKFNPEINITLGGVLHMCYMNNIQFCLLPSASVADSCIRHASK